MWAAACARLLVRSGVSPNTISVVSIFFAAAAGALFFATARMQNGWLFIAAALMVQARLLCNLFDGMVAVEGGRKTKSGEIYNELPDRIADPLILIGAGYALDSCIVLGWLAASLALLTAYVRALGVAAGASQQFCGPMAKPHRMAVITVAALVQPALSLVRISQPIMTYALALICIGCVITVGRRTRRIVKELESK
jgi:phosphatidylglycerophosphate synthase